MIGKYGQTVSPEPPHPAVFFGPSALVLSLGKDDSTTYEITLWVGGEGYNGVDDGGWGKAFTMSFTIPAGQRKLDIKGAAEIMIGRHKQQLAQTYGLRGAEAICKAIAEVADGKVYRRAYTSEEVLEGIKP